MCAIAGVYGTSEAPQLTRASLYQMQHRGQETAGLVVTDGREFQRVAGPGYVKQVITENVLKRMPGHAAVAHARYSTAGDKTCSNAQPIMLETRFGTIAVAHNGNLTNYQELKQDLSRKGAIFQTNSDTEVLLHLCSRSYMLDPISALADAARRVEGAYSLIFLLKDRDCMVGIRDPHGFRPLSLGIRESDKAYFLVSETVGLDIHKSEGVRFVRDINPGEMVIISKDGLESRQIQESPRLHQCVFEHVYFSRPDSTVFGIPVSRVRNLMGRFLAQEQPVDADIVVPVLDSGMFAAQGYAEELGLPLRFGLIRNHFVGRTFLQPGQVERSSGVKDKLNPVTNILDGKRVVLIDDSIIRGTTSREIVRMVKEAGATEVHMRISCAPTFAPCYYGVDTPDKNHLIAFRMGMDIARINHEIETKSLGYLSLEAMLRAVNSQGNYCTSCYTGNYPLLDAGKLLQIEGRSNDRLSA